MRSRRLALALALALASSTASAATRMVGINPSDGEAMLVKQFHVLAGVTITGVEFENNDPATVFPEVVLARGPLTTLSGGVVVASAVDAQETSSGIVRISWSVPVAVTEDTDYYLGITSPAGPGRIGPGVGPAVGANDAMSPMGSFVSCGTEGSLLPARIDLTIRLLTTSSPAGGGYKAGATPDEESPGASGMKTFLSVRPLSGPFTTIAFGLEAPGEVQLDVYDVSGKHIRELSRAMLPASEQQRVWDGRDAKGLPVATGIYFVRLKSSNRILTQKLLVAR